MACSDALVVPGSALIAALVAACSPSAPHAGGSAAPPLSTVDPREPPLEPAPTTPSPTAEAAASEAPPPPTERPGPCPADMVDVGVSCIDRYEAPNVKGRMPLLMQSAHDGQAWCEQRGKRLCRESEWVRACTGNTAQNFPYGAEWKKGVCNDDKSWKAPSWSALRSHPSPASSKEVARLNQAEPSGSREGCKSPFGVYDLTANAAEWVVRTEDNDTNYEHVVVGCYWARCYRPPHTPSCDYVNWMHRSGERSYEMGFRCCRDKQ